MKDYSQFIVQNKIYKRHFPEFSFNVLYFIVCLCEHTCMSAWNSVSFPSLPPSMLHLSKNSSFINSDVLYTWKFIV